MTTETDKVILKNAHDELARITAVIRENSKSLTTKGLASVMDALADGIDDCVTDYLDVDAVFLIKKQETRDAEPEDLPATSGASRDETLDDPRRGLAEHINRTEFGHD